MCNRIMLVILCGILLTGCATTGNGNEGSQDSQAQLKVYKNRIEYLEGELDKKKQEVSTLERQLDKQGPSIDKEQSAPQADKEGATLSNKDIQTALKNAGFYTGAIDGKIGANTRRSIKKFQRSNGLKADGVVGKSTSSKLMKHLSK
ncbi:MAG: peptidoglycan-binding domain-containing protein [Candidatus Omnitrophota bacterium]